MITAKEFREKHSNKPKANDLTSECLKLLNLSGFVAWRNNTTGVFDPTKTLASLLRYINSKGKPTAAGLRSCFVFRKNHGRNGVSDILGIHKKTGRLIAVEVKAGKDKLSQDQIEFLKDIENAGGIAVVVRCVDDLIKTVNVKA